MTRRSSPVRPAHFLLILSGLALLGCSTEVKSLTHVKASLEAGPGLGLMKISYLAREGDRPSTPEQAEAADKLAIQLDGQPVVLDDGRPLEVNNSAFMVDYFVPEGAGVVAFLRGGQTVATSELLEFASDRINYLVLYGDDPSAPELLVVEDPYEQRRVRLVNVHEDGSDVEFTLTDADGAALGDPATLEHGSVWIDTVAENVAGVQVAGSSASSNVAINCDPTFTLVVLREEETEHGPALNPLLAPSQPGSPEAALAACHEPTCDCD